MNKINKIEFKEFKLEKFVKIHNGFAFKSSEFKNKGIPIVRISNFNNSNLDLSNVIYYSNKFNNDKNKNYFLEENDILIAMSGATVGKLGFVIKENLPCILNQRIGKFKILNKNLLNNFLKYFLKSDNIQNLIFKKSIGCAQPNLSSNDLLNLKIPIPINSDQTPNLDYQKKVVKELEKIEKAIELKKKVIELNKEYLESLFYDMFGSPIKNEKDWKVKELKEICKIIRKSIISKNIIDNTKYVGLEHIEKETGLIKNYELINLGDLKSNKFRFDETMLLYGKLRPYLNKIALPNFSGICSTDILPLKPLKNIVNRIYLTYLLRLNYYIKLATIKSTGANLPRLSPSALSNFKIPVPPIQLQNKFAKEVEKYEKIREKQEESLNKLNDLFNSSMQRAFKGEL